MPRLPHILSLMLLWLFAGAATAAEPPKPTSYLLATATSGGTYYPVGVAIAALTKAKAEGVGLSAITSAGSAENIALLNKNEVQFAILQGLYADWARTGTGPFSEPAGENLMAVTALWPNIDHWLTVSGAVKSNTLDGLKDEDGLSLSIGKRNSGAEGSGRVLLKAAGIEVADDHFSLVYQGYGQAADALQNGTIDIANMPAGAPVSAVTRAMAARKGRLKILNISDDVLAALKAERPFFRRHVLPKGTYPGQTEDVMTTAQPNLLAVRADTPEEHVYQVTKAIYQNLSLLKAAHKATVAMDVHEATVGLPLPLHPGAARYFREMGVLESNTAP
ncbi:MAG: TAXI family TRAP transporter solute-binding subunit [Alphaproteobacteria bacterium]